MKDIIVIIGEIELYEMVNKKVILADIASQNTGGKSVGHFFTVADNYIDIFPECIIAGGPIYKTHIASDRIMLLPHETEPGIGLFKTKLRELQNLRFLLSKAAGNIIVFQQAALVTLIIFLCFLKKPQCKIYIIAYDDNMVRSRIKKLIFKIARRKIDGIICPNKALGEKFSLPYCTVPDYIFTEKKKKEKISEAEKIYDFCIVGRLSPEKGAIEIASHFKNTKYQVIIAGKPQDDAIKNKLKAEASGASNITLMLDYISIELYDQIICQSKYALLNYQGEYSVRSSGVVYDMLFSGIPVVGKKCKALQFIEDSGCGFLYESLEELESLMKTKQNDREVYTNNIEKYQKANSANMERLRTFILSNSD